MRCVLSWHCGVHVTKLGMMAALSAALLAFAGTASVAFEEQKAPAAPRAESAPAAGVAGEPAPVVPAPKSEGTEIRIPGLGKLGTLPKMDFGLELLYGAAETERQQEPSKLDDPAEDLTIKGSIKHNF